MSDPLHALPCAQVPRLLLAPMEGLLDAPLRDVLTRVGGLTGCVSEFIRVTDSVLPLRAWLRTVPELSHGSRTPAGVPVRPQLLGSDIAYMAENAARVAELGPMGVDLNFGCPAKIVNRHGGGAALLREPDTLFAIVQAVRRAVPSHLQVTAKMRLGFDDDGMAEVCAQAIEAGGASELVVHARTRADGYRPPARWSRVADVARQVRIPVVANGEIWSVDDALQCLRQSGCQALMLGRGMVADPGLALAIRARWLATPHEHDPQAGDAAWATILALLPLYWARVQERVVPRHQTGRIKQWLNYLRRRHPQAQLAFDELRAIQCGRVFEAWMQQHCPPAPPQARLQPVADIGPDLPDNAGLEPFLKPPHDARPMVSRSHACDQASPA